MPKIFHLPELGENIKAGDVVKVTVKPGDTVKNNQIILELETDKTVMEVPSNMSGIVAQVHVKAGDKAKVGQAILTFDDKETATHEKKSEPPIPKSAPAPVTESAKIIPFVEPVKSERMVDSSQVLSSPSVRKLAREIGIDIGEVTGSGKNSRITEDDVKRHARKVNTERKVAEPACNTAKIILPDFTKWGGVERKPMTNVRRKTAETMALAWSSIPHVTQHDEADITDLENLRKQFGTEIQTRGGNLTMTAMLLKIAVSALKIFPQFNASVDMEAQEIIYKKYHHIAVAVDTDRGLLVPVIRDVDKKNILQLSIELNQVAERARNKQSTLEELQGSTFTITNLGGIGGGHFTPIINPPEVAILGVGRYQTRPVFVGKEFQPRKILPLSLSYDHRIIDGADAARFLRWIAEAMNQPFLMDLEG